MCSTRCKRTREKEILKNYGRKEKLNFKFLNWLHFMIKCFFSFILDHYLSQCSCPFDESTVFTNRSIVRVLNCGDIQFHYCIKYLNNYCLFRIFRMTSFSMKNVSFKIDSVIAKTPVLSFTYQLSAASFEIFF